MLHIKRIIPLFLLLFISCRTIKTIEVPIETIRTEYVDKLQYDSIYMKDSVFILNTKDTVYINNTKYLYKYKYIKDTINIIDTIPKIVTVTDIKYTNKLYLWQKILMSIGAVFIIYIIIKLTKYIKY